MLGITTSKEAAALREEIATLKAERDELDQQLGCTRADLSFATDKLKGLDRSNNLLEKANKLLSEQTAENALLKSEIARLKAFHLPEQLEPKLIHIHTDPQGKKYYKYQNPAEADYPRSVVAQIALREADRRLTREGIIKYLDQVDHHFNKGAIREAAGVLTVIREQANSDAEIEGLWKLAAVWFIRDDEDPKTYDAKIAAEKIAYWKSDPRLEAFFLPAAYRLIWDCGDTSDERIHEHLKAIQADISRIRNASGAFADESPTTSTK